jgi:hypothetical protein
MDREMRMPLSTKMATQRGDPLRGAALCGAIDWN